jgi:hypothetical protein
MTDLLVNRGANPLVGSSFAAHRQSIAQPDGMVALRRFVLLLIQQVIGHLS